MFSPHSIFYIINDLKSIVQMKRHWQYHKKWYLPRSNSLPKRKYMSHSKVGPPASQNPGGEGRGRDITSLSHPNAHNRGWFCQMVSLSRQLSLKTNELLGEQLGNELLGSLLGGEKLGSHGSHLRVAVLQEHLTKNKLMKKTNMIQRLLSPEQTRSIG